MKTYKGRRKLTPVSYQIINFSVAWSSWVWSKYVLGQRSHLSKWLGMLFLLLLVCNIRKYWEIALPFHLGKWPFCILMTTADWPIGMHVVKTGQLEPIRRGVTAGYMDMGRLPSHQEIIFLWKIWILQKKCALCAGNTEDMRVQGNKCVHRYRNIGVFRTLPECTDIQISLHIVHGAMRDWPPSLMGGFLVYRCR